MEVLNTLSGGAWSIDSDGKASFATIAVDNSIKINGQEVVTKDIASSAGISGNSYNNNTYLVVLDNGVADGTTLATIPSYTSKGFTDIENTYDGFLADVNMVNDMLDYVDTKISALVNGAPETLDTLDEIAAALDDNADIVNTLNAAIGTKANANDVYTKTQANNTFQTKGNYLTTIPAATGSTLGGIKLGYTTSGQNYKVLVDSNNNAYVYVPWTDTNTTYSIATTSTNGLMSSTMVKTLNSLGDAATYDVATSIVDGDNKLVTGDAVYGVISNLVNEADIATVATTGNYNDLSNKPSIPTLSSLMGSSSIGSSTSFVYWNGSAWKTLSLSGYATSNRVDDIEAALGDLGELAIKDSVAWSEVTSKPTFASVATSGSYNDLSNKPTIPSAVTESTVSGWGFTKNTGTVTSVGMKMPTGLSVTPAAISTSGTFTVSYASGYSLPTTAKQQEWTNAATIATNLATFTTGLTDGYINNFKVDAINARTSSTGSTFGTGSAGQVLKSNGTNVYWAADSNTTYSVATTSADGLMSSTMVTKLNGIASGATAVTSATVSGWGYTKNAGTVTKISTGKGLVGGDITSSGTIKCNLNSETSLGTLGTTTKLYSVGVDTNGKLCVSVPWTDNNTTYTLSTITGTLSVAKGGTGATDAATARTNLGLGNAATYGIGSVASGNTGLVTGGSVYTALSAYVKTTNSNSFTAKLSFTAELEVSKTDVKAPITVQGTGSQSYVKFTSGGSTLGYLGFSAANTPAFMPSDATESTPLAYQSWVTTNYLPKTGGTITGALNIKQHGYTQSIYGNADGELVLSGSEYVRIENDLITDYGIFGHNGLTAAQWKISADGSASFKSVAQSSDETKKNVLSYETSLDVNKIADAPIVTFTWKNGTDKSAHVGSIAQYWKTCVPECVSGEDGDMSMEYSTLGLVSSIVNAREIVKHNNELSELRQRINVLEDKLAAYEAK